MKELKALLKEFWNVDNIIKDFEITRSKSGTPVAMKELSFYAEDTKDYKEFNQYTFNEIFTAFKQLVLY